MFVRYFFAFLVLSSFCQADSWGPVAQFEFASENGKYLLEIELDDEKPSRPGHCRANLFYVENGNRTKIWSRFLINNYAPVSVVVSDSGEFVLTMDEWGEVGKFPVVIYGHDGRLIHIHNLNSLLTAQDMRNVEITISSKWWNKNSISFFGPEEKTFFIQLHWGKLLLLKLDDGEIMDETWYTEHRGWNITEKSWQHLHQFAQRRLAEKRENSDD